MLTHFGEGLNAFQIGMGVFGNAGVWEEHVFECWIAKNVAYSGVVDGHLFIHYLPI